MKIVKTVLHLSVMEPWFSLMESGEKDFELRSPSVWIKSRLAKGGNYEGAFYYNLVKVVNGYGANRPYFYAEYKGFGTQYDCSWTFSNGKTLQARPDMIMIFLGEIVERGNIIPKMALTKESKMPFGKYNKSGTSMQDVPAHYLLWLYKELKPKFRWTAGQEGVVRYVEQYRDELEAEANTTPNAPTE